MRGPVAVLADSERFPGVLMVTVSDHAGWNAEGGGCIIDYVAGLAHRTGPSPYRSSPPFRWSTTSWTKRHTTSG